jgi:hypothetical protein
MTRRAKCSKDLSYVRSASLEKQQPGSSRIFTWYAMHSQQAPFFEHGEYVHGHLSLFFSLIHSMLIPLNLINRYSNSDSNDMYY